MLFVLNLLLVTGLLSGPPADAAQQDNTSKTSQPAAATTAAIQASAVDAIRKPAPYVLAGDDVLSINVLNFPKLSVPQVVVSLDGIISVPLLDPINVLGKTTAEVTDLLTQQWKRYIKNPAVSVTLVQRRQDTVLMYGFVNHPGATPYKPPMHVLGLLAQAGGALPNGDLSAVVVTHKDGRRETLDLSHPEKKGGTDQDIVLQADDVAYVPEKHTEIGVIGEIVHPGSYDYKEEMTVLDALTLAGGVNPDTADFDAATVTHNGKEIKLDLDGMLRHGDMSGNIKLAPGDRVMVPLAQNRTYVFGEVGRPGYYLFKPHDRVLDALNGCGGTLPDSDLMRVNVIHINKDKTLAVAQQVDLIKFLKKGKIEYNLALAPGDVIFVPQKKKAFGLTDMWNLLAPLSFITNTARILSGNLP